MSNGGYMSYSLACHHPDVFRAVGSVTGAMSNYDWNNCNPDEVVPVIHLHGTADLIVGYTSGVDFGPWGNEGVLNIIDLWTGMMGTTEVSETALPNLEFFDLSSVEFFRYYGAPDGQEFHHYRVSGGGHDWFGVTGNQDIESTELLWDFFQSHCAGEFTSVEEAPKSEAELVEWTGNGLRVLDPCHVRVFDLQGRLAHDWPNASAGFFLPRAQLIRNPLI
jgi:polyhydroxybutyrate depolymerase